MIICCCMFLSFSFELWVAFFYAVRCTCMCFDNVSLNFLFIQTYNKRRRCLRRRCIYHIKWLYKMDTAKRSQKLNCSRHFIWSMHMINLRRVGIHMLMHARSCISEPRSKVNVSHPISTSFFSSPQTLICINVRVLALMKLFTRPHSTADHQFYHNVWLHLTSKLGFFLLQNKL